MKREVKFRAWHENKMYGDGEAKFWLSQGFFDDFPEEFIIMQLTGLKDKNGIDIYEGDILDFDEREWGDSFKPEIIWMENIIGGWNYCGTLSDVNEWRKVIGNIYEIELSKTK